MGPIVTHDEMVPQFADLSKKKFNADNFAAGLYAFTFGLGKKVVIADAFGRNRSTTTPSPKTQALGKTLRA